MGGQCMFDQHQKCKRGLHLSVESPVPLTNHLLEVDYTKLSF